MHYYLFKNWIQSSVFL